MHETNICGNIFGQCEYSPIIFDISDRVIICDNMFRYAKVTSGRVYHDYDDVALLVPAIIYLSNTAGRYNTRDVNVSNNMFYIGGTSTYIVAYDTSFDTKYFTIENNIITCPYGSSVPLDNDGNPIEVAYVAAGAIQNIEVTSADANSRVIIGGKGNTSKRPSSRNKGYLYFDETLGKPIWWNGTVWVDATGQTV